MESSVQTQSARERIEAARTLLLRVCAGLVAALQTLLGALLTQLSLPTLRHWSEMSFSLRAVMLVLLIAGPIALGSGMWSLLAARKRVAVWIGAATIVCAGAVIITGVQAGVIPCAGPT